MEAIYLDPAVCGYFDVPYRNTHEWACSADAIYNSRPSWDSTHTRFLKDNLPRTLNLERVLGKDMPGWYRVTEVY